MLLPYEVQHLDSPAQEVRGEHIPMSALVGALPDACNGVLARYKSRHFMTQAVQRKAPITFFPHSSCIWVKVTVLNRLHRKEVALEAVQQGIQMVVMHGKMMEKRAVARRWPTKGAPSLLNNTSLPLTLTV